MDLYDERSDEFQFLIEEDVSTFVQKGLHRFYDKFKENPLLIEALEDELCLLVSFAKPFSINSWFFAEEWLEHLVYWRHKYSTVSLKYLYTEFEESEAFQWICDRFELEKKAMIQQADHKTLFNWMILWMLPKYPKLALFLIGEEKMQSFSLLKKISLKKAIFFPPKFMLWNIGEYLERPRMRHLFFKLAQGKNIRHIPERPVSFSKKMAHHFTNAPDQSNLPFGSLVRHYPRSGRRRAVAADLPKCLWQTDIQILTS